MSILRESPPLQKKFKQGIVDPFEKYTQREICEIQKEARSKKGN
jgi:hypothetical protein